MRLNDTKTFLNKERLTQMLNLRINGYSLHSLAVMFEVDQSSIRYQCDKYLIDPLVDEVYDIGRINSQIMPVSRATYKIIKGEKINIGKSYKEYLASAYPPIKI